MVNKPKNIGTAAESALKRYAVENGFPDAERLALSGALDVGDVRLDRWNHVEVKAGKAAVHPTESQLDGWLGEAAREGLNAGVACWLVTRPRTRDVGRWRVWTTFNNLLELTVATNISARMGGIDIVSFDFDALLTMIGNQTTTIWQEQR